MTDFDYKTFFERWGSCVLSEERYLDDIGSAGPVYKYERVNVEDLFQAFKARLEGEDTGHIALKPGLKIYAAGSTFENLDGTIEHQTYLMGDTTKEPKT